MTPPFSRTTLAIVIGVTLASLAATAALTILGKDVTSGKPSAGADTFSKSAIGHGALVALLGKLDIPVVRSRNNSVAKARGGLLVIAEPSVSDEAGRARLRDLVVNAPRALVVLPKWYGRAITGSARVDAVSLLPVTEVDAVLDALGIRGTIRRSTASATWTREDWEPVPLQPAIGRPQTLDSTELELIVGDVDGAALVAHIAYDASDRELWVLTDPDVLNNHGLAKPANARFTIELLDELRAGGPVVVDETLHGYTLPPGLLRTLFRFPLVLATLQVLICAVFAVWAAMVRFGPRRAAPPPIAPGKDFLIQNTASLLHYGGHHADALRRYLVQSVAAVRHALHAPALAPAELTAWLEGVRQTRGGKVSLVELEQEAAAAETPQRTIEVADRVYRWRMEMTHGSRHRS